MSSEQYLTAIRTIKTIHDHSLQIQQSVWTRWKHSALFSFVSRLLQLLSYGLEHQRVARYRRDHLTVREWSRRFEYMNQQNLVDIHVLFLLCKQLLGIVYVHREETVRATLPAELVNQMTMDTSSSMTVQDMYIWLLEPDLQIPELQQQHTCLICQRPLIYLKKESRLTCACNGETVNYYPMRQLHTDQQKQSTEYERLKTIRKTIFMYVEGTPGPQEWKLAVLMRKCLERGCMNKYDIQKSLLKDILAEMDMKSEERTYHRLYNDLMGIKYSLFTHEQAEEMVECFRLLQDAYSELKNSKYLTRQTFPRTDFAAEQFCRMHGWTGQRMAFQAQKVSKVLEQQMQDWKLFMQVLARMDATRPWTTYETR